MTTDGLRAPRACGVLLHVTSLPGPYGHGDLGPAARQFVDFLAASGQRYWQTLPIHPAGLGNSPYNGPSAFAGNPQLISLEDLVAQGLLHASELPTLPSRLQVDFEAASRLLRNALHTAFLRLRPQQR